MKKQILTLAMLSALVLSAHAQQPANQLLPYQNPNLSAEARANDLLSRPDPGGEDETDDGCFACHLPTGYPSVSMVERGTAWCGTQRICHGFPYHHAHGFFLG